MERKRTNVPIRPAPDRFPIPWRARLFLVLIAVSSVACSGNGGEGSGGVADEVFREILDLGAGQYVGEIVPETHWVEGDWTRYDFGQSSRARCMSGNSFRTDIRHGPSENLLIFLLGGGACLSDLCVANGWAIETGNWFDAFALMDLVVDGEPLTSWDLAVIAYCDGSLMAGDVDLDMDGDGEIDTYHRGLANLSAGVDVAASEFPNPKRIVLAGLSGGGYSTIPATFAVRNRWRRIPVDVINDHGIALARDGEPDYIEGLLDHWGIDNLIPPSCEGCTADGHLTELLHWQLARDPNLRIALLSSYEDFVIASTFLRIAPARFRGSVKRETGELSSAFPGRCESFVYEGKGHTLTIVGLDKVTAGGVLAHDWLETMLNRGDWTSAVDP